MLAPISGTRRDGGSSFRALKIYLGFRKNKETGRLDRRSELLISESLLSEQTAQAEMRAVASENLRVKDPVYHYQLCWQEDEFPEKDAVESGGGERASERWGLRITSTSSRRTTIRITSMCTSW